MANVSKTHIGACIRMAMASKGISTLDLAAELGRTPQQISRYRAGSCTNIQTLNQIAAECDMSLERMLSLATGDAQ
jgi:transcriptional regulator with XRE-family HTH domain